MVKNDYIAFDNGFYPNDWQEDSLGKLCDYVDYRGATPAKKARGIFLITAKNIKKGYIDYSISQEYVAANDYESTMHRGLPKLGDVLITTEAPVGNVAQVDKEKVALAQRIIKYCAHECVVNNTFLKYMLLSYNFQKKLESASTGGTVQGIKGSLLHNLKIAYPKIEEQTAIATALSDTDALIDSLEKLIAKKQAIKQGAMQELLTGKRRLKGFSGEWKEINLAAASKMKARIGWQGLTTGEYLSEGYAYLITGTDFNSHRIDWENCWFVDKSRYLQDRNIIVKNGDLLITKDGTIGKVAYIEGLSKPATLNSGVFLIRPLNYSYNTKFVSYVLSSNVFDIFLEQLSAGSTINHLYQKDFVKFVFRAPELKEQQAIAQILTDMDDEISALQKKLDKVRRIKQGMMAELLTGRIRLSEPSP